MNNWYIPFRKLNISEEIRANYPPLLSQVLASKGFKSFDETYSFIYSDKSALHCPYELAGMNDAVSRIRHAIINNEKIAVYGDYDVDGITATCLLVDYLRSIDATDCIYHIPDRIEDGYGLNSEAIDKLKEESVSLIITVDCGITAYKETEHAKKIGIDMVITDHHECSGNPVPSACAVVDPKLSYDNYPNKGLAGVGVAFKLVCALSDNTNLMLEKYSDLVALGTIADVMPLCSENRFLTSLGLSKINTDPRSGIAALINAAGLKDSVITAGAIGFAIAPRINAAGRLGETETSVDLLLCKNRDEANILAEKLCELNKNRQKKETEIWNTAIKSLLKNPNFTPGTPIILSDGQYDIAEKWHQGIIGIAASRLAEKFSVPTIMISVKDGIGKGSCRSYGGFNLYDALSECSAHLISFGGHALAAGINIEEQKIDDFRNALSEYYILHKPDNEVSLKADLLISDSDLLSCENVVSLDTLEPYGNGNQKPLMCISDAVLISAYKIGKNQKHLKLLIDFHGKQFECLYFSHTLDNTDIVQGNHVDIIFQPQINDFNRTRSVQLIIQGIRNHDASDLCRQITDNPDEEFNNFVKDYIPVRAHQALAWRTIKDMDSLPDSITGLLDLCTGNIKPETFFICLTSFLQSGLLSSASNSILGSVPIISEKKVDLNSTKIMKSLVNTNA